MDTNDYNTTIEISCHINKVFEAISNNLTDWWGEQSNLIDNVGTVFKISWGEPWYQFEVIKFDWNKSMVWECIDANQKIKGLEGIEKEWVGTKIHWELKELAEKKTLIQFRHEGLVPKLLCFNFCSKTWDHFLKESLIECFTKIK